MPEGYGCAGWVRLQFEGCALPEVRSQPLVIKFVEGGLTNLNPVSFLFEQDAMIDGMAVYETQETTDPLYIALLPDGAKTVHAGQVVHVGPGDFYIRIHPLEPRSWQVTPDSEPTWMDKLFIP